MQEGTGEVSRNIEFLSHARWETERRGLIKHRLLPVSVTLSLNYLFSHSFKVAFCSYVRGESCTCVCVYAYVCVRACVCLCVCVCDYFSRVRYPKFKLFI